MCRNCHYQTHFVTVFCIYIDVLVVHYPEEFIYLCNIVKSLTFVIAAVDLSYGLRGRLAAEAEHLNMWKFPMLIMKHQALLLEYFFLLSNSSSDLL